ncbi:Uu.00g062990.m01.CDS01 [Anthostomella pinea]|uniref:Uu.00g062990.m01.CDS01 n=1 Tax=Anthostomella pinea TaxID=933095 RepID=A0AAI8VTB9_9PEZI|nr:Uu.00g062990.m01.CDS01 [Anthostomella pinea]
MPLPQAVRDRRAVLSATAAETKAALPAVLHQLPDIRASLSEEFVLDQVPELDPADCPRFNMSSDSESSATLVKVINRDTLDAAIIMADSLVQPDPAAARTQSVAMLSLASDKTPGGGWLSGAMAQEEALCYRSSLSLSLHALYYPWSPLTGLYTRDVVVVRSSLDSGHRLLSPPTPAAQLPVVSVISVAAIRRPAVRVASVADTGQAAVFKYSADRRLTKSKMRLILRVAANKKHELLVLGAFGCGAFRNPPEDVARCWLEVLGETEFSGGWWREIWFAVLDSRDEGNFRIFEGVLGGKRLE